MAAYDTGIRFLTDEIVGLTPKATVFFDEVAALRNRKGPTTRQWNPKADQIGLKGELAVMKRLGLSAEEALELFLQGLKGDNGWDFTVNDLRVDVKTTTTPDARFRFNTANRRQAMANSYCLVWMQTIEHGLETFQILGWAEKHKIKPYCRSCGTGSERVDSESLIRDGILKNVQTLMDLKAGA